MIASFVPDTRNCFGLYGTIKHLWMQRTSPTPTIASVQIGLCDVRLTPDWSDRARVALAFSQNTLLTQTFPDVNNKAAAASKIAGVFYHSRCAAAWRAHRVHVVYTIDDDFVPQAAVRDIPVCIDSILFNNVTILITPGKSAGDKLFDLLVDMLTTKEEEVWLKKESLMMNWNSTMKKKRSSILKRMLCRSPSLS